MLNFQGCLTLITFFLQGRTLLGHDYVFWCGDFNYRVNMCREDVLHCVKNKDWETLLSADQLKVKNIQLFLNHRVAKYASVLFDQGFQI